MGWLGHPHLDRRRLGPRTNKKMATTAISTISPMIEVHDQAVPTSPMKLSATSSAVNGIHAARA
jgi:hypothetical protein